MNELEKQLNQNQEELGDTQSEATQEELTDGLHGEFKQQGGCSGCSGCGDGGSDCSCGGC